MKTMKTRKLQQLAFILVSAIALTFSSCAKESLDTGIANPTTLKTLSADENDVQDIMNDAEGDVSGVLSNDNSDFKSSEVIVCNATIDSLTKVNDTIAIFITYNGLTCNGKFIKTGKIEIRKKAGMRWYQPGAAVILKFINFTVTKVANNKSIKINGTKTLTNVNGGLRWQLRTSLTSYVERVTGNMQVSFDNGTTRTWNVARQLTYTLSAPPATAPDQKNYILSIDGFGTEGDYKNLVVWGTNRDGEHFYTAIKQSVVHKQACKWDPVSGIKIHQVPSDNKSATVTFGYNDNNEPIGVNECPTRYRVDWQKNNKSGTSFFPL